MVRCRAGACVFIVAFIGCMCGEMGVRNWVQKVEMEVPRLAALAREDLRGPDCEGLRRGAPCFYVRMEEPTRFSRFECFWISARMSRATASARRPSSRETIGFERSRTARRNSLISAISGSSLMIGGLASLMLGLEGWAPRSSAFPIKLVGSNL